MSDEAKTTVTATNESNNTVGSSWKCRKCGLVNDISNWNCIACYATFKSSMIRPKKDKKETITPKKNDIYSQRAAKRREIYKNQSNGVATSGQTKSDEKKDDNEPKYRLAPNIPKTMKVLIKEKESKGYTLKEDYPVPMPGKGELLIRSFSTSICGSDLILYHWGDNAKKIGKVPFIPGLLIYIYPCTQLIYID